MTACSSNKVKHIDTSLDYKGQVNDGVVGLRNDEALIQDKQNADDALRVVQWKNFDLESDLNYEQSMVTWCYNDLSDPRLGGNEEVAEMPGLGMKSVVSVKEELGLDEKNNLVVVKTMDFKEKMEAEKKYTTTLESMLVDVKKTRAKCERKMGYSRQKIGLPAKRSAGTVILNESGSIKEIVSPREHSLDDAFKSQKPTVSRDVASKKEESPNVSEKEVKVEESPKKETSTVEQDNQ